MLVYNIICKKIKKNEKLYINNWLVNKLDMLF